MIELELSKQAWLATNAACSVPASIKSPSYLQKLAIARQREVELIFHHFKGENKSALEVKRAMQTMKQIDNGIRVFGSTGWKPKHLRD